MKKKSDPAAVIALAKQLYSQAKAQDSLKSIGLFAVAFSDGRKAAQGRMATWRDYLPDARRMLGRE